MKLATRLTACVTTVVVAAACGGTRIGGVSSGSGTGGQTMSSPDAGLLARPPPPGPQHLPDGTTARTFAITKLDLGDADPGGMSDPTGGWKHLGYNLDGVSPGDLGAFCKAADAANPARVHEHGDQGIENSFGHQILPILLALDSKAPFEVNQALAGGAPTLLITVDQLGAGASYDPLEALFDTGGDLGSPPKLDGSDVWPVTPGSVVSLPSSYLVGDTWVSGPGASVTLTLAFSGSTLVLNIGHAIVSMNLDPSHQHATGGILAGVIATADLESAFTRFGPIDVTLCSSPTIQSLRGLLEQASDILQDGTQDPNETCDGISIGIGFDGARVQLGPEGPPPPPPPNPCGDGG